jgi:release factor glutamine methyltransferase
MTRAEALKKIRSTLAAAEIENPLREADLLLAFALEITPLDVNLQGGIPLSSNEEKKVEALLTRRAAHEPLGRIKGKRGFWRHEFVLNEATLEPRADTETLVEAVLAHITDRAKDLRILDIGTGSGCILISLLQEYEKASGIGTDISHRALEAAAENARTAGIMPRAFFTVTSWAEGLHGPFDVIMSNPPYIAYEEIKTLAPEVRQFDPLAALDGGADGLEAYRALIPQAYALLKANGALFLEVGQGQAADVVRLLEAHAFKAIETRKDLSGIERVVFGIK